MLWEPASLAPWFLFAVRQIRNPGCCGKQEDLISHHEPLLLPQPHCFFPWSLIIHDSGQQRGFGAAAPCLSLSAALLEAPLSPGVPELHPEI